MIKVLIHSANQFCIESFNRSAEKNSFECIITSDEKTLFEYCSFKPLDAYIISSEFEYAQRAINTIRGVNPGVPIVSLSHPNTVNTYPTKVDLNYLISGTNGIDYATYTILSFIVEQTKIYDRIKDLTPKKSNEVYFGDGLKYDTMYRSVYLNGILLRRFSVKEGKLLEILSLNFGKIVNRDSLMNDVWGNADIYISRSFDVYITKLRNFFREYDIKLQIKNISGVGLVLE